MTDDSAVMLDCAWPTCSEGQRQEVVMDRLQTEFGGHLAKLGLAGTSASLMEAFASVIGRSGGQMAAPQALRLLAIAYKVRRQFAETFSHVSPTASPHVPHVAPTPT